MSNLTERAFHGRFTFYDAGLGACGKHNKATDYIVALNSHQYGGGYPGPNCFRPIHITFGGKSADAVIMDLCPECPYEALDLSRSLFDHFANEGEGVIYGQWWFTDEGGGGNSSDGVDEQSARTTQSSKPKTSSTLGTSHKAKNSSEEPTASSKQYASPTIRETLTHESGIRTAAAT